MMMKATSSSETSVKNYQNSVTSQKTTALNNSAVDISNYALKTETRVFRGVKP